MHNLVTQADAKKAAEQGLIPTIKKSIEHHEDPGKMTRGQLIDRKETIQFKV